MPSQISCYFMPATFPKNTGSKSKVSQKESKGSFAELVNKAVNKDNGTKKAAARFESEKVDSAENKQEDVFEKPSDEISSALVQDSKSDFIPPDFTPPIINQQSINVSQTGEGELIDQQLTANSTQNFSRNLILPENNVAAVVNLEGDPAKVPQTATDTFAATAGNLELSGVSTQGKTDANTVPATTEQSPQLQLNTQEKQALVESVNEQTTAQEGQNLEHPKIELTAEKVEQTADTKQFNVRTAEPTSSDELQNFFSNGSNTDGSSASLQDNQQAANQFSLNKDAIISTNQQPQQTQSLNFRSLASQLIESIKTNISKGKSELEVQLKPDYLGKVHLKLSLEDGVLAAKIAVENQAVGKNLENNLQQLRQSFQEQGLKFSAIDVEVGSGSLYQEGNNQQQQQSNQSFSAQTNTWTTELDELAAGKSASQLGVVNYLA
ncbi:flagellar hook-length control protein FliK [Bacillota bacterium LX-D]|nr:flagellar hook-length control protein FliK [Bacillota bacterium LX-D]